MKLFSYIRFSHLLFVPAHPHTHTHFYRPKKSIIVEHCMSQSHKKKKKEKKMKSCNFVMLPFLPHIQMRMFKSKMCVCVCANEGKAWSNQTTKCIYTIHFFTLWNLYCKYIHTWCIDTRVRDISTLISHSLSRGEELFLNE